MYPPLFSFLASTRSSDISKIAIIHRPKCIARVRTMKNELLMNLIKKALILHIWSADHRSFHSHEAVAVLLLNVGDVVRCHRVRNPSVIHIKYFVFKLKYKRLILSREESLPLLKKLLALYSVFECQQTRPPISVLIASSRIVGSSSFYTSCPTYDLMDETLRRLSHVFPNLCENGILLLSVRTTFLIIYLSFFFFHKVLRRHFSISHQMTTTIWAIHTNCHPQGAKGYAIRVALL